MRRLQSVLFMPGNNPGMLISGDVLGADALIFDLEDAVAVDEKDAARHLVSEALHALPRQNARVAVRINPLDTPYWQEDLCAVLPKRPDALVIPKATPKVLLELRQFCKTNALDLPALWPLLESPQAIVQLPRFFEIQLPYEAMLLGGEDYAAAMGVARTQASAELLYARSALVTYAKAYECLAIDTPFTDFADTTGLIEHVSFAKGLGFDGILAIHPSQVAVINQCFMPTETEITWAKGVLQANEKALAAGLGVFSFAGKMVDRPVLMRAEAILARIGGLHA